MEVMYFNDYNSFSKKNNFTAILGDIKYLNNVDFINIKYDDNWTVKKLLNGYKFMVSPKIHELFQDFDLNINLLKRKVRELSSSEKNLVLLIYSFLNNEQCIVLNYFEKCLSYKNKRRVVSYLKSKYEGTLLVISNDIVFLNELCDFLIIFDGNNIIFNDKFDYIYKSNVKIDYPPIINFIKLANKKSAKLVYTVDNKELLKDIYRSVK